MKEMKRNEGNERNENEGMKKCLPLCGRSLISFIPFIWSG